MRLIINVHCVWTFDSISLVTYNSLSRDFWEDADLVKGNEQNIVKKNQAADIEHMKKRLDMLDRRLDNIDSIVTAVAERVMKQPVTLNITCPKCGQSIEIAIIGTEKLRL